MEARNAPRLSLRGSATLPTATLTIQALRFMASSTLAANAVPESQAR
jgi:hypothetical protein